VHICFGYAAVVKQQKPTGYSFLPQLADTVAQQISIEAAQPRLDLGVLRELSGKQVMLGVLDLGDAEVETAETVAARIRAALRYLPAERLIPAPDCGMKYLPRATAFGKLKALADGAAIVRRELAGSVQPRITEVGDANVACRVRLGSRCVGWLGCCVTLLFYFCATGVVPHMVDCARAYPPYNRSGYCWAPS